MIHGLPIKDTNKRKKQQEKKQRKASKQAGKQYDIFYIFVHSSV